MADIEAILSGDAAFPAIGATKEDCEEMFRVYIRLCERASQIIDGNNDPEDLDQERERQQAVADLLPAMKAMATMLMTQDAKLMTNLFVNRFMNDNDCLRFFEVMKANNPHINEFVGRVTRSFFGE